MLNEQPTAARRFELAFSFVSHGVAVGIEASSPYLLERAREQVVQAFGGLAEFFEGLTLGSGRVFGIAEEDGVFTLFKNGDGSTSGSSERNFFKYLNSLLRLEVGEFAVGQVFVHAGVVGWKGQAIVLPAKSHAGKSTLTAELVRLGAEYYSDEYAVIGPDGLVKPFPRKLSLRFFGGTREKYVSAEELGGRSGKGSIPVGMLLFTGFIPKAEWKPEILSEVSGIMELIPNMLTFRQDPEFSLKVLDLVVRRAIIVRSSRGDVKKFARVLLAFFDNHTKLAKMT